MIKQLIDGINQIPEDREYWDDVIKNLKPIQSNKEQEKNCSMHDMLMMSFKWSQTSKGRNYWGDVYEKLEDFK